MCLLCDEHREQSTTLYIKDLKRRMKQVHIAINLSVFVVFIDKICFVDKNLTFVDK